MIMGVTKVFGKAATALWVIKTAAKAYKGYKKTKPAIDATNKVFKIVKGVKNTVGGKRK